MVVQLNPAITNRTQVAFGKSNSGSTSGKPKLAGTSAIKESVPHKSSALGRWARRVALGATLAISTVFGSGCHKDPGVTPDPKPGDTTTHVVIDPPVVTNEKAVMPYMNTYFYNAQGVDTVAYPAKSIASFETNVTPAPVFGKPYKETFTFNKELSSEDTIVMDIAKNDTLNGRIKFFVEKDPASGAKNLASKNWQKVKGKLEHVTDVKYRKTTNSIIGEGSAVLSGITAVTLESVPDGKRNVEVKNGTKLFAKVTNVVTKLKSALKHY